jgi:hypothetical protein
MRRPAGDQFRRASDTNRLFFQGDSAMFRKVALVFAGVLLIGGASARADDSVFDQMYGNGVHAYFGGDYSRAYDNLSAAIRGGSRDPRIYYFRAFAETRLGREQDAAADFQTGASFEATSGSQNLVSQALERIQGPARTTLEQYRENARAVAVRTGPTQPSGAPFVLRREAAEPTTAPRPDQIRPLPPTGAAGQAPGKAGPLGTVVIPPQRAPTEKPAEPADPFSSDAAKPPAEAPATKPAAPAEKPGAPEPANPFGDAAKPAEKSIEKPADASDPFNSDTKPAEKPAAKEAGKAAEKPADADPFSSDTKPAAPAAEKPAAAPADAKPPAGKDATAADVKPQPAAARGVIKALNFGDMFTNTAANLQQAAAGAMQGRGAASGATAAANSPAGDAPSAKPAQVPAAAAASPPDPFAPAQAAANGSPPAASAPAAANKASDPFTDEPPSKTAPEAKTPDKAGPDMKKDDPFKS